MIARFALFQEAHMTSVSGITLVAAPCCGAHSQGAAFGSERKPRKSEPEPLIPFYVASLPSAHTSISPSPVQPSPFRMKRNSVVCRVPKASV